MWLEITKLLGVPLVAGIVAAFLSNYLSARFNFARYRKELWWQAKREAYESIIRHLSELMFNAEREIVKMETGGEIVPSKPPSRTKELSWNLQEIASSGAYIVTEKTVEAIQAVLKKMVVNSAIGDFYQQVENDYDAAKTALEIVRAEARKDLRVD